MVLAETARRRLGRIPGSLDQLGGEMKFPTLAVLVLISGMAVAQTASSRSVGPSSQGTRHDGDSSDRMFFPRDMFWGWAQLDLAPPHNEIDPNLCSGNVALNGGIHDRC